MTASVASMRVWLERYAEEAVVPPISDEVPRRIDEHIAGQMPELAQDPMLVADLHASTRAQWRVFAANLTSAHSFTPLPQAADLARSLARRGLELSVLLKVYRSAHKVLFDYFAEVTAALGPQDPAPTSCSPTSGAGASSGSTTRSRR
ncbi:hypothetical protein [Nocardioides sambongensis]|uniref:hypothetical protein n=1 Tax=Nocardioides sambongensis TaxID=2589074 RepID=UPI00112E73D2|nr:hypothetical protein [Nocardioides sambongensis]